MTLQEIDEELARRNFYFDTFYEFYQIQQSSAIPLYYNLCWSSPETKCLNVWSDDPLWFKQVFMKNNELFI